MSTWSLLEWALVHARRGWAVHPLRERSKEPLLKRWPERATTDVARIRHFWSQRPHCNVGIATGPRSSIFVLDVDGEEGEQSLARLEAKHGALPRTYEVRTGREGGGRQKYFVYKLARSARIPNSESKIGLGLDVRGDGGYVLAAGSIHPDTGRVYEVICGGEPAVAPDWLVELVSAPEYAPPPLDVPEVRSDELDACQRAALASAPHRIRSAKQGERNRTLNREAHGLARLRIERRIVEPTLKNAALDAGLTPVEVRKTFESGWRAGLRAVPFQRRAG